MFSFLMCSSFPKATFRFVFHISNSLFLFLQHLKTLCSVVVVIPEEILLLLRKGCYRKII